MRWRDRTRVDARHVNIGREQAERAFDVIQRDGSALYLTLKVLDLPGQCGPLGG
jgi:hypothetical protein